MANGSRRHRVSAVLAVAAIVAFLGVRAATFWTDVLWFDSVGYETVFWRRLVTQLVLGVVGGAAVAAVIGANLALARRLQPLDRMSGSSEEAVEQVRAALAPVARWLIVGTSVLVGLLAGLVLSQQWLTLLRWLHARPFGRDDPFFGRDLGWFVFVLPFHTLLASALFTTLLLTVVLTAAAHYLYGGVRPQARGSRITPAASAHLSVLLAALVAVRAWRFLLDRYHLSYSSRGGFTGLSYTDVHAQLPANRLLFFISVACVVLFLVNLRFRGWLLPSAAVGILAVAAIVLGGVYPAVVQRVQVEPEQLEREREFIAANLSQTRFAFGVDDVEVTSFAAADELTPAAVADNADTLTTIRLWDPTNALGAYEQLQELRIYYEFVDIDVDRYETADGLQQVLIGARELSATLPSDTWLNRHLVYTHGFGVAASPAHEATANGQPEFLARNIPVEGDSSLVPDEQSRVYFGEGSHPYSIVGTAQAELDYPTQGDVPVTTTYTGGAGVPLDSMLRRLAFAVRFGEPNIVLSNLLGEESEILLRRDIRERVRLVAPFLLLDHDPYPAVVDGRIVWILDAYTTTNMIPYAQRVDLEEATIAYERHVVPTTTPQGDQVLQDRIVPVPGLTGEANYIRNSVKAVVDAYDGDVTLYVTSPDDPLIGSWSDAFPGLFTPMDEASDALRRHFRYPEDMFRVQADIYRRYHIATPEEFYSAEDAWRIPEDRSFERNGGSVVGGQRLRPLFQLLRLPGESDPEFALLQPYSPANERRQNLSAYLAGRSDPEQYGQLRAFVMPPTQTVFGPEQVLARIDQDDQISEELTLLGQRGSQVIYGDVVTLPIDDALLYALPLFIRAEDSPIPELVKVVLVLGDRIVMRDTLADSLAALLGVVPGTEGEGEVTDVDERVAQLVDSALQAFAAAERALRDGDLGAYRQLTEQARERLEEAQRLLGGPVPEAPETDGVGQ